MLWNVFFEGAVYGCWLGGYTQILFQIQYSKEHLCSEMYFLSEQFMVAD